MQDLDEDVEDLLRRARTARHDLRLADHEQLVARLASRVGDDESWEVVVAAEQLRDVGYSARSDDELRSVRDELGGLLERAPDAATRARLLSGRGQTHARLQDAGWGTAAARDLRAAARAFVEADEPDDAYGSVALLAWSVQLLAEGLRPAERTLGEAIELARSPSHQVSGLSMRAKARSWLGDLDGAMADVERALGVDADLGSTAIAYLAWAEVTVAAALGHGDRAVEALGRAEAHLDGWHDTVTGIAYDVDVAEALARLGRDELAWRHLDRARARRDEEPDVVRRGELLVSARIGDPAEALEAWHDVRRQSTHEAWERARMRLLAAWAQHRRGDDPSAAAARAFDEIAQRARPDTFLRREADLMEVLLPAAAHGGSRVARWLHRRQHGWSLDLLDRVELRGPDGEVVSVAGRVGMLLAVLLDADGPMDPERVAALVWEDEAPGDAGDPVARVRRLLHRVRGMAPVVERGTDGRLQLSGDLTGDVPELELAIERAREGSGAMARLSWLERAETIASRVDADRLAAREDLPVAMVRRLQRELHWVHREVAEAHHDAGRDHLARRQWRRALALVPDDDAVAVQLGRSLVGEGRRGDALQVVRDTRAAIAELGLRPSRAFESFEATLQADA